MTTAMRLNLVADSLDVLKLSCHVHAVREAASEIEVLQKEVEKKQTVNEILRVEIERKDQKHLEDIRACHSQLTSIRSRVAELEKDKERLLKAFRHTHRNNSQNDNCAFCGLDLRDEIHIRISAMSAEKK